jgi:pyridoxamine 5'-phosphate oxidase
MNTEIAEMRREYRQAEGTVETFPRDPFGLFAQWFSKAVMSKVPEPNAMAVATVSDDGKPSARMVLLKDFDHRGFVFYTDRRSRKGRDLGQRPFASLVFWWAPLERQVRVEGDVEEVSSRESAVYFATRPRSSQLSSWASVQSTMINSREMLDNEYARWERTYKGVEVPSPPSWTGYRICPLAFEFWQGGPHRLHDRLRYRLADDGEWTRERLSP